MTHLATIGVVLVALISAGAPLPAHAGGNKATKGKPLEFKENRSGTAGRTRGVSPSKIEPTRTEAALKFTLVDKKKGPIKGIVISLTDKRGKTFYTDETDARGYAEVLVPVGQTYELVYLSLGRRKIAARLPVSKESRQTIRLTLRYKRWDPPRGPADKRSPARRFVLKGLTFDTGRATIHKSSLSKLEGVVEYMTHKPSSRVEISGYTDNVGNDKRNTALSKRRAQACRKYLISRGIDGSRVSAVGYGQLHPIASNDTEEGRQQNRRIEVIEL